MSPGSDPDVGVLMGGLPRRGLLAAGASVDVEEEHLL